MEDKEEMRICTRPNCGGILDPTQQRYCSRGCYSAHRKGVMRVRVEKEPERPATWRCEYCDEVIVLDFDPKRNRIKFDNYTKAHECKKD